MNMNEDVILESKRVFRWDGPERKTSLTGTKFGRLVLTDQRLLFVSSGRGGIVGQFAPSPKLEESALLNDGSLAVPLSQLNRCEFVKQKVAGYLSISFENEGGSESSYAFMNKYTLEHGKKWAEEIEKLR
jgi:hypothetical protein